MSKFLYIDIDNLCDPKKKFQKKEKKLPNGYF
jgi:hypothetical protein